VLELVPAEATVRLETSGGSVVACAAVVAAGPWVSGLVGDVPVSVTRETVVHFRVAQNGLPTVIDHSPPEVPVASTNQAAYALASPGIGLKAGVHRSGELTDPDQTGGPDAAVVEAIVAWARDRYELAESSPALVETCLYTNTEDQRFVLERRGPIVICSACSGHGFKFAPILGRCVADLVDPAPAE
jgi:sarcosine oxidase